MNYLNQYDTVKLKNVVIWFFLGMITAMVVFFSIKEMSIKQTPKLTASKEKTSQIVKSAKRQKTLPSLVSQSRQTDDLSIAEKQINQQTVGENHTSVVVSEAELATTSGQAVVGTAGIQQPHVRQLGTLSNGNAAGEVGSRAAAEMAAATGVSQETWEYIIARESNGNSSAQNASGASGLFQTMPGWGATDTVEAQINAAINAYNAQGLAAWGM